VFCPYSEHYEQSAYTTIEDLLAICVQKEESPVYEKIMEGLRDIDTYYYTSIRKTLEKEHRKGQQELISTAVTVLKENAAPDDVIAQAFSLPIEQVRAIQA
jgi:hypothetical protein